MWGRTHVGTDAFVRPAERSEACLRYDGSIFEKGICMVLPSPSREAAQKAQRELKALSREAQDA